MTAGGRQAASSRGSRALSLRWRDTTAPECGAAPTHGNRDVRHAVVVCGTSPEVSCRRTLEEAELFRRDDGVVPDHDEQGGDPACWSHLYDDDGDARVLTARIVGVPVPDVAVWVSTGDPDVSGDLDHPPAGIAADDRVVLAVRRHGFRWVVSEMLDHVSARRGRGGGG